LYDDANILSFPRRRESGISGTFLDSRLRGNDVLMSNLELLNLVFNSNANQRPF